MLILISFEKDLIEQSEEELVVIKGGADGKEDFAGLDLFLWILFFHDFSKTHTTTRLITEHKAMFHLTAEQTVKEVGKGFFGGFARLA